MSSLHRNRSGVAPARVVMPVAILAGLAVSAPSASAAPILFSEHVAYSTGIPFAARLTLADLNGDGHADIVTSHTSVNAQQVSVLRNLGDGTFGAGTQVPAGATTRTPAAGDLDNDGDLDLVVGLQSNGVGLAILENNGLGQFGPPELHAPTQGTLDGPAIVDLDGDDDRDIVFAQAFGDEVVVLVNQGGGSFATPVSYGGRVSAYFVHLSVGDVDGDADPDLVVGRSLSNAMPSLYRNRGDGTFESPQAIAVEETYDFAGNDLGDLDGDGDLDLVFVAEAANRVLALRNDGSGSFSPIGIFSSGVETQFGGAVTLADLDRDGRADAIVPAANTFRVATLRSTGAGFEAPVFHPLGREPGDVAAVDLDGDSALDLACTQRNQSLVSVLLNRTEIPTSIGPQPESEAVASFGPAHSNPVRHSGTSIPYVLVEPAQVRIAVYDVAGRQVRLLFGGTRPAGRQIVSWDGRRDDGARVAGGVYVVELNGGAWRRTTRVVVLP